MRAKPKSRRRSASPGATGRTPAAAPATRAPRRRRAPAGSRPAEEPCARAEALELLDVPRAGRIHVNRNLRLASVRAIGFDMDHTLACYRRKPFEALAFDQAQAKVAALGYPRETLALRYDPDFVIRGLIVDRRRGNILKMDRHHYAVQAFHGTRKLPPEMRKDLYARRRVRIGAGTFVPVDSPFSVPEISLYAQMVDLMDRRERRPDYRRLYDDVRAAIDEAHADGSIKSVIARAPLRYLEVDGALAETLERLRTQGTKLFLLTNSEPAYSALVMERLLTGRGSRRRHWTGFFDLVVVRAEKPAFFARHEALRPLDARILGASRDRRPRFAFAGGCVSALERALGVAGDEILYFGDHTYGDIMKSKRAGGWRTAMIIRELEEELERLGTVRGPLRRLEQLERRADRVAGERDFLERALEGEVPPRARARYRAERGLPSGEREAMRLLARLEEELEGVRRTIAELEAAIDACFNEHWGSIFRAGREISHFGNQVGEFACIYTSRVSNFRNYPMDKYFLTAHEFMPHEH